jgi:hypothetical protein
MFYKLAVALPFKSTFAYTNVPVLAFINAPERITHGSSVPTSMHSVGRQVPRVRAASHNASISA